MEPIKHIQPNLSNGDLVALIKEKIEANEPFTMTRFGDGELGVLRRNLSSTQEKRMCINWNYKYPRELDLAYNKLGATIFRAFDSNVIGLMDNETIESMNMLKFKRRWAVTEAEANRFCIADKLICNHIVARSKELGSMEAMKGLLNGKDLHVISIRTRELQHLSKSLDCKVTFTDHNNINLQNRSEILKSFDQIEASVVVFATGLMKDYGVILRDQFGKIAIDMGATVDAWAGIESRIWFKPGGLQDYLTKR